jgi:hypothetical protein
MDDFVPISSPEAARQHFDEYRRRIAELLQGGLPVLSNPEHAKAVLMLIQYADLQITRVALWSDGAIDLLAYVTRNLLEWSLWCKYLNEAPTNIDTLLKNEAGVDAMDMFRLNPALNPILHARVFPPDDTKGPVYKVALERAQDATSTLLKTFEAEHGQRPKRVPLGEFRNEIEDYVFKICSKLLHPTSVSILLFPNATEAQLEIHRVHFRSLALYYAKAGLDALLSLPSILH